MLESLNIWDILLFSEVILAFILFSFLVRLTSKSKVYLPLLTFTFLSFFEFSILVLTQTEIIKEFPHLIDINEPFFMLFGLLLFLYARNQVHQQFFFKKNDILFFIPFILALLIYFPDFSQTSNEKLTQLNIEGDTKFDILKYIWEWNFYLIVNVFFLIKALKELTIYNLKLKAQLSSIRNSSLYYTQLLIKVCLGLYIIELVFVYLTYYGLPNNNQIYLLLNILSGIVLLLISVDAIISHKHISENKLSSLKLPSFEGTKGGKENIKYASSGLDNVSSRRIKTSLLQFMEEQKPYLEPQLRIKDLSKLTGFPVHHLSQVINESFDQNFYEFINGYRIKDAMRILKDSKYQNYTYESIAFEVGFNSRSAFYTAFKKVNNTTPSKF